MVQWHLPIFFLLAQKENGQKEKGHGNRTPRGEPPAAQADDFDQPRESQSSERVRVRSKSKRTGLAARPTPPSISGAWGMSFCREYLKP